VQHIAFATGDIFAALDDLLARGLKLLPIPENDYADLVTRFDIPPDLLKRMQSAQVLYNEEDGKAFFQAYARPTAGWLFFELVQRMAGYQGCSAAGAPFRLAAQKRAGRPQGMPRI
jgi:4-hydroxyphenylpyruvate dioxygenase